jgi:hypothetical protein
MREEWPAHALDVVGPQHRQLIRDALQRAHVKEFVCREQLSSLLVLRMSDHHSLDVIVRLTGEGTSGSLCWSFNIVVASTTTTAH